MPPSTHSLGLAWLPGLGLPWFLLLICPFQAVPTNHTYKFSYSYHMRPKFFNTYAKLWEHDTLHIHTWIMVSLFVPPRSHQAGRLALTPHVRNRNWSRHRHSVIYSDEIMPDNLALFRHQTCSSIFSFFSFILVRKLTKCKNVWHCGIKKKYPFSYPELNLFPGSEFAMRIRIRIQ